MADHLSGPMKPHIEARMRDNLGRITVSEMARLMDIDPKRVYRWAHELGIRPGRGWHNHKSMSVPSVVVPFPPRKPVISVGVEDVVERMMRLSERAG